MIKKKGFGGSEYELWVISSLFNIDIRYYIIDMNMKSVFNYQWII